MGVLHHARYFAIFERARTELLRASGKTYRELEEEGILLPLVEASAKYRAPVTYDGEIRVETRILRLTPLEVSFGYMVRKADGAHICEGFTRHAIVGPDLRLRRLTALEWQNFRNLLLPYLEANQ